MLGSVFGARHTFLDHPKQVLPDIPFAAVRTQSYILDYQGPRPLGSKRTQKPE